MDETRAWECSACGAHPGGHWVGYRIVDIIWYFCSPQIVFGEGALGALDELRGRRALIVTGTTLVKPGLVDEVKRYLDKARLEVRVFDAVEPDSSVQTVRQGALIAQECAPDWIIGLGNGSPMDAAKAIWILYERPDLELAEINPFIELGLRKKARLVTIPATRGIGYEVIWAIVFTDMQEQRKLSLGNRENMADMAIADPEMVMGMPPRLAADTGLYALTHAVEGYTCTWHTDMTDGLCLQAAQFIFRYLPRAVADGNNLEAREKMHITATLAGLGFGNSLASMAHAMGHALGALYHVPHGRAVGIMLLYTIEYIAGEAPERFADLARVLECGCQLPQKAACALAERIRAPCREIGNPTGIAALGVAQTEYEVQLEQIVERAFNDASLMTTARSPSYEGMCRILEYVYAGRPIDF